ncbi:MAG: NADP-dependent isocitrate dehydrogenase [Bdellovibrionota bacterium]|nr:NADP-dependent isocitrate dehydrogenase [Bdellovibrionota bacterium]
MKIIYTLTDEAPFLATQSFLPIVRAFSKHGGVEVETRDISLAARVLAQFPERLKEKVSDDLAELGQLTQDPNANIIKLPNISASIPQLKECIKELQAQGYDLPDFPEGDLNAEQEEIKKKYAKVLGSAVNPVLREGNSDRRVAGAVKEFAKNNPHSMGEWLKDSKTHVASMNEGDFFGSEQSVVKESEGDVRIEFVSQKGDTQVLKDNFKILAGEVIDSGVMSAAKLKDFFAREIENAKKEDILLSLHMKATMMKVSDPIIFGHAVKTYYADVFEQFAADFEAIGVNPNNGIGDLYAKLDKLEASKKEAVLKAIAANYEKRPRLAMVNSDKGITNLHVPSDVIIDASMPAAIRAGGKMWGADNKTHDTKAMIPDRSYASVYQETINFCKENGAFDVTKMGNVSNVGLMAKKAEEYGSHDKTFEMKAAGHVQVVDASGTVLMKHDVQEGDIFRMCQTKDIAIRDWVKLGVNRAKATGNLAIFWLDANRAHDKNLITKVETYLKDHDTTGLDIRILAPAEATRLSCETIKAGKDTISITGNVLRDYLTDLFPILELGTSAKMLSIVPLLAGGGLYETGAGGSAPKHVEQVLEENHLRWDSLGEFLALAVSLNETAEKTNNNKLAVIAKALDKANTEYLLQNKSPSRKAGELDNRGTHFFLSLFWAQALSEQTEDSELKSRFESIFKAMNAAKDDIIKELNNVQGSAQDIGGYYHPSVELMAKVMRPSQKLNTIIESI